MVTCRNIFRTILLSSVLAYSGVAFAANECDTVKVNVSEIAEYRLSDIASGITLYPIRSNDITLIPRVDKVSIGKQVMLVRIAPAISYIVCDLKGKLLFELPVNDARIDDSGKCIWAYNGQAWLKQYSFKGKELSATKSAVEHAFSIMRLDDGFAYITNELVVNQNGGAPKMENRFQIPQKAIEYSLSNVIPNNPFFNDVSEMDDCHSMHIYSDNVIYSVAKDGTGMTERYLIDFGEQSYPSDFMNLDFNVKQSYMWSNPEQAGGVSRVFESASHLSFSYRYQNCDYTVLYCKENGKVLTGNFENDLFQGGAVTPVGSVNDGLLFVINDPWHATLTERARQMLSKKEIEYLESVDENTDYIVFKLKLAGN